MSENASDSVESYRDSEPYRALFELSPEPAWLVNRGGNVVSRNAAANRFGSKITSINDLGWRSPEDADAARTVVIGDHARFETSVTVSHLRCEVAVVRISEPLAGAVLFVRDRSRLVAAEAEVARLGRMRLLGNVLGGVAHDLQNVFSASAGFASLARENVEGGSEAARIFDAVTEASENAARWMNLLAGAVHAAPADRVAKVGIDELLADTRRVLEKTVFAGRTVAVRGATEGYVRAQPYEAVHLLASLVRRCVVSADVRESLVFEVWHESDGPRQRSVISMSVGGMTADRLILGLASRVASDQSFVTDAEDHDRLADAVLLHRVNGGDLRVAGTGSGDRIDVVFGVARPPGPQRFER